MLLFNAVVLSVLVMLILSVARVHVIISLFVASLVGGLVGMAGFFLVPVVGLPIGFTLGVYLWELVRGTDQVGARAAAWEAVKAQGLAILFELGGCLVAAAAWGGALIRG